MNEKEFEHLIGIKDDEVYLEILKVIQKYPTHRSINAMIKLILLISIYYNVSIAKMKKIFELSLEDYDTYLTEIREERNNEKT